MSQNADSVFRVRRLATVERELGLTVRAFLAKHETPPAALVAQHREVWHALLKARQNDGSGAQS